MVKYIFYINIYGKKYKIGINSDNEYNARILLNNKIIKDIIIDKIDIDSCNNDITNTRNTDNDIFDFFNGIFNK